MEISHFDIIVLYDRIFLHYYYNLIKVMKAIVTIPKKSSSLLLMRKTPSTKFSLYNYQLLVLQRKVDMIKYRKSCLLDPVLYFLEGKQSQRSIKTTVNNLGLKIYLNQRLFVSVMRKLVYFFHQSLFLKAKFLTNCRN